MMFRKVIKGLVSDSCEVAWTGDELNSCGVRDLMEVTTEKQRPD